MLHEILEEVLDVSQDRTIRKRFFLWPQIGQKSSADSLRHDFSNPIFEGASLQTPVECDGFR